MGKLIELLNEFEKVKTWYATYTTRGEKSERELKSDYMYDEDQNIIQIYIISKSFGFIKWLVENDKIDFSPIPNRIKEIGIPMKINGEIKYGFDSSDYYWLLMLLSIQDNPVEFLIGILK